MKNQAIVQIIKDRFYEQKMNAEYQLQLTKVVEFEDKFAKDFSKEKWKEYFDLDIEIGQLHNLEIDRVIEIIYQVSKKLFLDR